jgi:hypothetical protein
MTPKSCDHGFTIWYSGKKSNFFYLDVNENQLLKMGRFVVLVILFICGLIR